MEALHCEGNLLRAIMGVFLDTCLSFPAVILSYQIDYGISIACCQKCIDPMSPVQERYDIRKIVHRGKNTTITFDATFIVPIENPTNINLLQFTGVEQHGQ